MGSTYSTSESGRLKADAAFYYYLEDRVLIYEQRQDNDFLNRISLDTFFLFPFILVCF